LSGISRVRNIALRHIEDGSMVGNLGIVVLPTEYFTEKISDDAAPEE
jgi:hypothetical protein